jgi:hypothetical protein
MQDGADVTTVQQRLSRYHALEALDAPTPRRATD